MPRKRQWSPFPHPYPAAVFRYNPALKYGAGASAGGWDSMSRPTHRLTAKFVRTAPAGMHADGAGLYLLVTPQGTASWIFRYRRAGKLRDMGLGSARIFTLAEARERAQAPRRLLADGLDPIDHRRLLRAAQPRTWAEARDEYIDAHEAEWKTPAQAAQWRQSLKDYGPRADLPMALLDTDVVLACLRPLWRPGGKVETATRVRGRIERIWDAERVRGTVSGLNPAKLKGHLEHLLPKAGKLRKVKHHAAMPYAAVPAFMATLRARTGLARRALEFTILTAARTAETIEAPWSEFHGTHWRIPGERMKAGETHEVPLVPAAIATLHGLPRNVPPFPLSENGMLALLQQDLAQPYTVHGFRSSFYDWAREEGEWPEFVIDACLAHKVKDEVKAAYGRGKLLRKRRELMEAWAAYLAPT